MSMLVIASILLTGSIVGVSVFGTSMSSSTQTSSIRKKFVLNKRKRAIIRKQVETIIEAVSNGTVKLADVDYGSLQILLFNIDKAYSLKPVTQIVEHLLAAVHFEEANHSKLRVPFAKTVFSILEEAIAIASRTPSYHALRKSSGAHQAWKGRWDTLVKKASLENPSNALSKKINEYKALLEKKRQVERKLELEKEYKEKYSYEAYKKRKAAAEHQAGVLINGSIKKNNNLLNKDDLI